MFQRKQRFALLAILCIWAAACSLGEWRPGFAVPSAIAEEDQRSQLEISVFAKPEELVAPGDVMLSFTIENISDADAQNVYLSSADGLLSEPVGQLAAGQQQSFNRLHTVSHEELEDGAISYIISHDDPDDPNGKVNYTVHAEIRRSDVLPQAEFTRRFSSTTIAPGSELTITYHIRNTGNVALTNLRVQDPLGDYTGGIDRLEAGESRSLISRVVMDASAASAAVLDYSADGVGDVLFTHALQEMQIAVSETAWEADLAAGISPFAADTADVVLTLRNHGETDIRNITVSDESYGGVIADHLVLPAGEMMDISHSYALRGEMQFHWKITGVSETSETVILRAESPSIARTTGEALPLSLAVSTDTPRIRRSGNVDIAVHISNPGGTDVQDVVLSESAMGELYTFAVVPAGGSVERTITAEVKDDASYAFSISYGEAQMISAAPLEIVIASDGVLPKGAKNSFIEFTGSSIKIGGSSIFAALLISGLAVLIVLIVLLVIASRRARIEKQLRIAVEKQRRREETGRAGRTAKSKAKGR